MPVPSRVNLITLGVTDLERATRFYQALGWPLSSASVSGEVSFFRTTGCVLGLWSHDSLAADANAAGGSPPAFRGVALAINVGDPAAVDAALVAAVAAGGTLPKPAERVSWGGYSGYFADPDGHLWEVAHNPGWPQDDDGIVQLPE